MPTRKAAGPTGPAAAVAACAAAMSLTPDSFEVSTQTEGPETMDAEMQKAISERQRAEAAKRKSDEMLTKELALKKDGETELRDAQRQLAADTERAEVALRKIHELQGRGAQQHLGAREKDEILNQMKEMQDLMHQTDQITLQLKRRVP